MTKDAKKELIRHCGSLLLFAVLLRFIISYGPMLLQKAVSVASTPAYISFLYYLNTGQILRIQDFSEQNETSKNDIVLRFRDLPPAKEPEKITPPKEPVKKQELSFSQEEVEQIVISGNCKLPYDKDALLHAELPNITLSEQPTVLIVHTHASESYAEEPGWEYQESDTYRTLDQNHSVVRLGAVIAEILESHGIAVIHDTTVNDYPSYNGSYGRMETIISDYLAKYPSIEMVLDVHRDAFELADGTFGGTAVDGTAQIMLVVGTNEGGLYHPNWQDNLSFALKLDGLMNRENPNLSKGIRLCSQRYNTHLTPRSLLVEFGAAGDTMQEALRAADAFGAVLSELLLASVE